MESKEKIESEQVCCICQKYHNLLFAFGDLLFCEKDYEALKRLFKNQLFTLRQILTK